MTSDVKIPFTAKLIPDELYNSIVCPPKYVEHFEKNKQTFLDAPLFKDKLVDPKILGDAHCPKETAFIVTKDGILYTIMIKNKDEV